MAQETTLSLCKRIYICAISLDLFKHVYSFFHLHSNIQYTFYNTMMIQKKAKRLIRTHSYVEFHLMSPIARQLQTLLVPLLKNPRGAGETLCRPRMVVECKRPGITTKKARKINSPRTRQEKPTQIKKALSAGELCLLSDLGMPRLVGCPNPRAGKIKILLVRCRGPRVLSTTA